MATLTVDAGPVVQAVCRLLLEIRQVQNEQDKARLLDAFDRLDDAVGVSEHMSSVWTAEVARRKADPSSEAA